MRYGKEHKQATRRRIVEMAGRRFKRDGSGVVALMADAGLTAGAFVEFVTSLPMTSTGKILKPAVQGTGKSMQLLVAWASSRSDSSTNWA